MGELTRRQALQGVAAVAVAATLPSAAVAAASEWVEHATLKMQFVVRYSIRAIFQPSYDVGDRVQIKLKDNERDRRTFRAESLEWTDGQVFYVVPAGAVPWRWLQAHWRDVPSKFRASWRKWKLWRKPGRGRLYVVGTRKGYVLVPAHRMRRMGGAKVHSLIPQQGREP